MTEALSEVPADTSTDPNADFRELCFETISRINAAHAAVLDAEQSKLKHALTCGELLTAMKQAVGHGNWSDFLATHCPDISDRTASFYMKLAKNRGVIETTIAADPSNQQRVADLSLRAANKLIPKSPSTRTPRTKVVEPPSEQQPEETLANLGPDEVLKKLLQANWSPTDLDKLGELIAQHLGAREATRELA
jgi:hypothetical protein